MTSTSSAGPTDNQGIEAERVLADVARHLGGLQPDEVAAVYGAVVAQQSASAAADVSPAQVAALSQALGAFRAAPCRFCHLGLVDHALDLSAQGVGVWCTIDQRERPLPEWLGTHSSTVQGGAISATLLWVGIPLVSLGLLSWVMPAVAAAIQRRRSWAGGAVVFLALAVAWVLVLPDDVSASDPVGDGLLFFMWLAGAAYGATQIKPWLKARSSL